jgi:hypothetical protein
MHGVTDAMRERRAAETRLAKVMARTRDYEEALEAIYELLCEAEKHNRFGPTREQTVAMARLVGNAIEWCKTEKQPEWDEKLAARRARAK